LNNILIDTASQRLKELGSTELSKKFESKFLYNRLLIKITNNSFTRTSAISILTSSNKSNISIKESRIIGMKKRP